MVSKKASESNKLLTEINKEIYEKNYELNVRNQSLQLVRKIYEIINTEIKLEDTVQRIIVEIIKSLKFDAGAIFLADKKTRGLILTGLEFHERQKPTAVTKRYEKLVMEAHIKMSFKHNLLVQTMMSHKWRTTENLHDLFAPSLDLATSKEIQNMFEFKRFLAVPILFGKQAIGVMVFGISKSLRDFTTLEREIVGELTSVTALAVERAQIYVDLLAANKRLREIDKLKDEFVSIASHELRTPLTAIKGYLWLSLNEKKKKLDPELEENLKISLGSTERLLQLVQEMLTVSRIQGHRFEYNGTEFDLVAVVRQVYQELAIQAHDKDISFTFTTGSGTEDPIKMKADKDKMKEVFHNLIGNALKFTPKGGKVTVTVLEGKHEYTVIVTDTGPGIPEKDRHKLFTKFGKLDYPYKKIPGVSGTGLGLYISKKIVDLHKGKIEMESVVDKGTTFTVNIPKK